MDVDEFYNENYGRMISYAVYGGLDMDTAKEVVSECYIYHINQPDKFKEKWWRHKVVQVRMNIMAKDGRRLAMEAAYHTLSNIEETGVAVEKWELLHSIDVAISSMKNKKHREILNEVLIDGHKMLTANRRKVVSRFKQKMRQEIGQC